MPLHCPDCDARLLARVAESYTVHDCTGCSGVFVPLAARNAVLAEAAAAHPEPFTPPALGPAVYRACPVCAKKMRRVQFGRVSRVVLQECVDGTWFSTGQLEAVGRFLANGGAERAAVAAAAHEAERAKAAAGRAQRRQGEAAAGADSSLLFNEVMLAVLSEV